MFISVSMFPFSGSLHTGSYHNSNSNESIWTVNWVNWVNLFDSFESFSLIWLFWNFLIYLIRLIPLFDSRLTLSSFFWFFWFFYLILPYLFDSLLIWLQIDIKNAHTYEHGVCGNAHHSYIENDLTRSQWRRSGFSPFQNNVLVCVFEDFQRAVRFYSGWQKFTLCARTLTGLTVLSDRFIWSRCPSGYGMQSPNWTRYSTSWKVLSQGIAFMQTRPSCFSSAAFPFTQRTEDAALIFRFKRVSTLISLQFN